MKLLLQLSTTFPTKMQDESGVLGFLCHMIRMEPLLPIEEDADSLYEPTVVANVKANITRYEDVQASSKYETLYEIISYFQQINLSNPNFLRLAFQPNYELKMPYINRDAMENINFVQNILASVKTASLIDQITGQDFQEMTRKYILNRRIDLYTDSWTKYAKVHEVEHPEEDDDTSVGAALKNLSISVTALKQASLNINQSHFFFSYLEDKIKQLNFLESRSTTENRQTAVRGRNQGYQGDKQFRPRYQNFNLVEQRGINQPQQNMAYPQQQQGCRISSKPPSSSNNGINKINSRETKGRSKCLSSLAPLAVGILFLGDPYQDATTSSACLHN